MKAMKTMKFKRRAGFLTALLALLGFAACEKPVMYGTPSADFQVKVTIKNETDMPIKDISVGFKSYVETSYRLTDANGVVELFQGGLFPDSLRLDIRDLDGVQNGSYRDTVFKEIVLEGDYVKKSDGAWYRGVVGKDVTVVLKEIEENE